jgi:putative flippase GtrA
MGLRERLPASSARFARFLLAGGFTSLVQLVTTTLLLHVADLPVQPAVAIAYVVTITTHFTLQRFFVFAGQGTFALSPAGQLRRYAAVAAVQYPLTAGLVAVFVWAGLPDLGAVVLTMLLVTPVTFVVMRTKLFHAAAGDEPEPESPYDPGSLAPSAKPPFRSSDRP